MRKKILIIIFIGFSVISTGQNVEKSSLKSLTKVTNSLIEGQRRLDDKFGVLLTNLNNSNTLNDSLKRELIYYRAKEDYYVTALNEQSTRFTLIITSVLALFGLLSFGIYKLELNRIKKFTKKKIQAQKEEFVEHIDKINGIDENLNLVMGNLNVSIAIYFAGEESYTKSIEFYLIGAKYLTKWKTSISKQEEKEEDKFDKVFINLKYAEDLIDKISSGNIEKEEFKEENKKMNNILDDFIVDSNPLLTNQIAEIRVKLNEYGK